MSRHFLVSLTDWKIELAWAAGLFDGEGSFFIISANSNSPGIRVPQSYNPEVLHRFAAAVGGLVKVYGPHGPYGPKQGPKYHCSASGFERIQAIGALLWPYLSTPKREQFKRTMAQARKFIPWATRTHCPKGHEYTAENTLNFNGSRSCRECGRTRARNRARALAATRKIA